MNAQDFSFENKTAKTTKTKIGQQPNPFKRQLISVWQGEVWKSFSEGTKCPLNQTTLSKAIIFVLPPGSKKGFDPTLQDGNVESEDDIDEVEPSAMTTYLMKEWDQEKLTEFFRDQRKKIYEDLGTQFKRQSYSCHDRMIGLFVGNLASVKMMYEVNDWSGYDESVDALRKRFAKVSLLVLQNYAKAKGLELEKIPQEARDDADGKKNYLLAVENKTSREFLQHHSFMKGLLSFSEITKFAEVFTINKIRFGYK